MKKLRNHKSKNSKEIYFELNIMPKEFSYMTSDITVTDLANSCVTPLFRCPQGSKGCLEKRNHPLSSNLVVWCAKIGPKTKKVRKTSELTKQMSKKMVFQRFFKVT